MRTRAVGDLISLSVPSPAVSRSALRGVSVQALLDLVSVILDGCKTAGVKYPAPSKYHVLVSYFCSAANSIATLGFYYKEKEVN
jgi:hypothetical protein